MLSNPTYYGADFASYVALWEDVIGADVSFKRTSVEEEPTSGSHLRQSGSMPDAAESELDQWFGIETFDDIQDDVLDWILSHSSGQANVEAGSSLECNAARNSNDDVRESGEYVRASESDVRVLVNAGVQGEEACLRLSDVREENGESSDTGTFGAANQGMPGGHSGSMESLHNSAVPYDLVEGHHNSAVPYGSIESHHDSAMPYGSVESHQGKAHRQDFASPLSAMEHPSKLTQALEVALKNCNSTQAASGAPGGVPHSKCAPGISEGMGLHSKKPFLEDLSELQTQQPSSQFPLGSNQVAAADTARFVDYASFGRQLLEKGIIQFTVEEGMKKGLHMKHTEALEEASRKQPTAGNSSEEAPSGTRTQSPAWGTQHVMQKKACTTTASGSTSPLRRPRRSQQTKSAAASQQPLGVPSLQVHPSPTQEQADGRSGLLRNPKSTQSSAALSPSRCLSYEPQHQAFGSSPKTLLSGTQRAMQENSFTTQKHTHAAQIYPIISQEQACGSSGLSQLGRRLADALDRIQSPGTGRLQGESDLDERSGGASEEEGADGFNHGIVLKSPWAFQGTLELDSADRVPGSPTSHSTLGFRSKRSIGSSRAVEFSMHPLKKSNTGVVGETSRSISIRSMPLAVASAEEIAMKQRLRMAAQAVNSGDMERFLEVAECMRAFAKARGKASERLTQGVLRALELRLQKTGYSFLNTRPPRIPIKDYDAARRLYFVHSPGPQLAGSFAASMIFPKLVGKKQVHVMLIGSHFVPFLSGLLKSLAQQNQAGSEVLNDGTPGTPSGRHRLQKLRLTVLELATMMMPKRNDQATMHSWRAVGQALGLEAEALGVQLVYQASCVSLETMEEMGIIRREKGDEAVALVASYQLKYLTGFESQLRQLLENLKPDLVTVAEDELDAGGDCFLRRFDACLDYGWSIFSLDDAISKGMDRESRKLLMLAEERVFGLSLVAVLSCEGVERVLRPKLHQSWHHFFSELGLRTVGPTPSVMSSLLTQLQRFPALCSFRLERDWLFLCLFGEIRAAMSCWTSSI